jgi:hypothetical protein
VATTERQFLSLDFFVMGSVDFAATAGTDLKVGFEGSSGDGGESAEELLGGATPLGCEAVLPVRALADGLVRRGHDALLLEGLEEGIERPGAQLAPCTMAVLGQNAVTMAGIFVEYEEDVQFVEFTHDVAKRFFLQQAHLDATTVCLRLQTPKLTKNISDWIYQYIEFRYIRAHLGNRA